MRRISKYFYIIICSGLLTLSYSCSKEPDNPTTPSNDNNTSETILDVDGNIYHAIKIGNQTWLKENLKVSKFCNGDSIPLITHDSTWMQLTEGAYSYYENDSAHQDTYGNLYNWYVMNDSCGICPTGWHVPSKTEWETLINYLGGDWVAGGPMKETGTNNWLAPNTDATNQSGFSGLPGGSWSNAYGDIGKRAYWWTETGFSPTGAYYWSVNHNSTISSWNSTPKAYGLSIRCVKD